MAYEMEMVFSKIQKSMMISKNNIL